MFFLSLCFIIQFIIACACLAVVSVNSQFDFLKAGWQKLSNETIEETQMKFRCCGFNTLTDTSRVKCPPYFVNPKPCFEAVRDSVAKSLEITGIVGLIFCFTNVSAFK